MITHRVDLQGTIQPDGTLVLDKQPNLPPGRVRVIVEQVEVSQQSVMEVLEEIWAEQDAHGYVPRSSEEVEAERAALREEDEERLLELERLQDEGYRRRYGHPPPDVR